MSQASKLLDEFKRRGSIFNYELATDYHLLQYVGRIYEIRHKFGETIECLPDPQKRQGVHLYKYIPKEPEQAVLI
jgi:hypothetical protein